VMRTLQRDYPLLPFCWNTELGFNQGINSWHMILVSFEPNLLKAASFK
jgi:hypothetical protein